MLAEMQRVVDHIFIWSDEKIFGPMRRDCTRVRDAGDLPEGSRTHLRRMKET